MRQFQHINKVLRVWRFLRPWSLLSVGMLLLPLVCTPATGYADEGPATGTAFKAGVLELAGSTGFSMDYQREGGSNRENIHLRVSPSLGYFVMDGLQVALRMSYVFDKINEPHLIDERSHSLLFALGPVYHFYQYSDLLVPYVGLTLGTYYMDVPTQTGSRSDLQVAVGAEAGWRWMVTENLGVKLGFQYVHGFEQDFLGSTDFFGLEAGFSVFIPTWPGG